MLFHKLSLAPLLVALLASCVPGGEESEPADEGGQALMAGAGLVTFDRFVRGCLDGREGVDCSTFTAKRSVYLNATVLPDGEYFFAVLAPDAKRNGFLDGAEGNLSDTRAGGTRFDVGSGDRMAERTFEVFRHRLVANDGSHAVGTNVEGQGILGLAPFDDTNDRGGAYVLAVCRADAASATACRFDAFRVQVDQPEEDALATASGMTYYDRNTNGRRDLGEPPIGGFRIGIDGADPDVAWTLDDGRFRVQLPPGNYRFSQLPRAGESTWMQTGNLVEQTMATGGAAVKLGPDKAYAVLLGPDSSVNGLYFGDVCLGGGGGHGKGFWSSKRGMELVHADDLALLRSLELRGESGAGFEPYRFEVFRDWLRGANASNMAYMLSAQVATLALDVHNGFVGPADLVFAPGIGVPNANGFNTVSGLLRAANDLLRRYPDAEKGSPERAELEAAKDALEAASDGTTFVQDGPESCLMPVF